MTVAPKAILASLVAMTLSWSCGGGATDVPEDAVAREQFIGAYLDLRIAALSSGATTLVDEIRDSVLAINDVTEQDLLDFVDSHGEDVEFMRNLWTEVESRLTERLEEMARDEENDGTEEGNTTEEIQDGDGGVSP